MAADIRTGEGLERKKKNSAFNSPMPFIEKCAGFCKIINALFSSPVSHSNTFLNSGLR